MRIAVFVASLLGLAVLGYLAITSFFLAHAASAILKVGQPTLTLSAAERPTDPFALGYRGDPTAALGLPFTTVNLETPLGPTEAWLVPAAGTEAGRAVYVHGIAGAREDGYRHLKLLHDAGWSVLLISYRNDPGAPADPVGAYGFGLIEWPDLEAAVAQMAPEDTAPGILVVAESMGGAILGQFLAQSPLAGRVKAVALDSPALSFRAVIEHLSSQSGRPFHEVIAFIARQMIPWQTGLDLGQAEVASVYTAFPGPLFIAHGTADRLVPAAPSEALAGTRSAPTVTLWTKADHLGSYAEDPDAYGAAFAEFLAQLRT
ncbi:MAG: hypothetical protein MUE83_17785 [Tabrizicola sp.]|jgi:hypothetical protein|nr:hypothetical protein [Tabrizicola sp.]